MELELAANSVRSCGDINGSLFPICYGHRPMDLLEVWPLFNVYNVYECKIHSVQTGLLVHPASYPMTVVIIMPGHEIMNAWSFTFTPLFVIVAWCSSTDKTFLLALLQHPRAQIHS